VIVVIEGSYSSYMKVVIEELTVVTVIVVIVGAYGIYCDCVDMGSLR